MAKHKTLQQKKLADIRRANFVYSLESKELPTTSEEVRFPYAAKSPVLVPSQTTIAIPNYSYIKHDILKTFLLTLSIIVFQIILFILLKKQIVVLPNIIY